MAVNLIGKDIEILRKYYDEALTMQGIKCKYQFPNMVDTNAQGEAVIDSYSEMIDTHIFFDGNPKIKTYKRLGWITENDKDLPFLIHCSFNLPNLQRDCLFHISGQYTNMPDRIFRITELTCDIQCPDHMIAQVIPVYEKQTVGRTKKEIEKTFNKSSHFISNTYDYRGKYISEQDGER